MIEVVGELRGQGVSVIYISHRLGEVERLVDRVVALRDGRNAGGLAREEVTYDRMVRMMVGCDLKGFYQREAGEQALPAVFEVRGLRTTERRPGTR